MENGKLTKTDLLSYDVILSFVLQENEARTLFRQMVAAVAFTHENGYAHRDIKPVVLKLLSGIVPVADPGENLTGALHSNFGRGECGGRGWHGSWIYAMMLLSETQ